MKICHVSDNHGQLWKLDPTCDVVVHSGDLLPNRTRGVRAIEEQHQGDWVLRNLGRLVPWIGPRRFLYTPGNHDYFDPCPLLREAGIEAHNLHEEGPAHLGRYKVAGFPWVNHFTGEWNYELGPAGMELAVQDMESADIIVAHAPIYGVLDRNSDGNRCGNPQMRDHLSAHHGPSHYWHGHIHESHGAVEWKGIKISNAATVHRPIILL